MPVRTPREKADSIRLGRAGRHVRAGSNLRAVRLRLRFSRGCVHELHAPPACPLRKKGYTFAARGLGDDGRRMGRPTTSQTGPRDERIVYRRSGGRGGYVLRDASVERFTVSERSSGSSRSEDAGRRHGAVEKRGGEGPDEIVVCCWCGGRWAGGSKTCIIFALGRSESGSFFGQIHIVQVYGESTCPERMLLDHPIFALYGTLAYLVFCLLRISKLMEKISLHATCVGGINTYWSRVQQSGVFSIP